jgi:sensor histidine kinase regulating citrate/malate metabolism
METDQKTQLIISWIISLAMSVVCCSILFVVFANYLNDIKKSIATENMQLAQMALNEERLLSEIQVLRREIDAKSDKSK